MPDPNTTLIQALASQGFTTENVVSLFLIALFAGIGAYFVPYLKTAGKQKRLNEEFETLLKQLKTQADAVGRINKDFTIEINTYTEKIKSDNLTINELLKKQISRDALLFQKKLEAVAALAGTISAANHAICWLCWTAKCIPSQLKLEHLDNYDKEIHEIFPKITSGRVILAGFDPEAHAALSSILQRLYDMDIRIGQARAIYAADKDSGIAKLSEILEPSWELEGELLAVVIALPWMKGEHN